MSRRSNYLFNDPCSVSRDFVSSTAITPSLPSESTRLLCLRVRVFGSAGIPDPARSTRAWIWSARTASRSQASAIARRWRFCSGFRPARSTNAAARSRQSSPVSTWRPPTRGSSSASGRNGSGEYESKGFMSSPTPIRSNPSLPQIQIALRADQILSTIARGSRSRTLSATLSPHLVFICALVPSAPFPARVGTADR
jgi:hypothetical protein